MFLRFFKAVAKSAAVNVPKALLDCLPMGGAVFDFARDAVRHWKESAPAAEERRAEVAALAVASLPVVRQQAEQAVAEAASDQPEPLRRALVTYLTHLPGTVRRSLSRPADLTGTTVPAGVNLDEAKDVLPFLPTRPSHKELHPGKRFGDWELAEMVGVGGFGEVWRATNPHLPDSAFKFCTDALAAKALRNDAALLGLVMRKGRHPGIVSLDDTNLAHDPPYLRFEYVAGGDLAGLIHEWAGWEPAKRVGPALQVMQRLAEVVGFAHKLGIVHRDLKPANVLLSVGQAASLSVLPQQAGSLSYDLRIADFGIGGVAAGRSLQETRMGTTPGEFLTTALRGSCTPLYASPQQRRGENPDPRDDVYSLGVIWYQLLLASVQTEVGGDWRDELAECETSEAMLGVLSRCLATKAEKRIGDANQFVEELKRLDGSPPVVSCPAASPSVEQPMARPSQPAVLLPGASSVRTTRKAGEITTLMLPGGVEMKFAHVPAGTFWMGGGGSKPAEKQVTIAEPFALGIYPVTQGQWCAVMVYNPSYFSRSGSGAKKVRGITDEDLALFPVEQVSWKDVQEFLHNVNEKERDSGLLYRLPTEAEWEYACRGGALSLKDCSYRYYFHLPTDTLNSLEANIKFKVGRTSKVGSYAANRLGLFDMHGNVKEWTSDLREQERGTRGGAWNCYPRACRAATQDWHHPAIGSQFVGFRIAQVPSAQ